MDSNNRIHLIITIILNHSPCTATTVRCMEKQSNTQHSFANRVGLQFTAANQIKVRLERLLPPKPCLPALNRSNSTKKFDSSMQSLLTIRLTKPVELVNQVDWPFPTTNRFKAQPLYKNVKRIRFLNWNWFVQWILLFFLLDIFF